MRALLLLSCACANEQCEPSPDVCPLVPLTNEGSGSLSYKCQAWSGSDKAGRACDCKHGTNAGFPCTTAEGCRAFAERRNAVGATYLYRANEHFCIYRVSSCAELVLEVLRPEYGGDCGLCDRSAPGFYQEWCGGGDPEVMCAYTETDGETTRKDGAKNMYSFWAEPGLGNCRPSCASGNSSENICNAEGCDACPECQPLIGQGDGNCEAVASDA